MRVYVLWLLIAVLCVYSIKDFFKPTCFLIIMMAFYGHPDMPTNVAGIQGFNPWNVLMVFCVLGYLVSKRREGLKWDLDGRMTLLLLSFLVINLISSTRLLLDYQSLLDLGYGFTRGDIISEYFINQLKWLVPGFLVFVGARGEDRRRLALGAIIVAHVLIALIVIRRVPLGSIDSGLELTQRGLKVLQQAFGWSRVNTAMILAGGAWAALFATRFLTRGRFTWLPLTLFGVLSIALAMTGGRMGWATWVVLGTFFSFFRWRKGLVLFPLAALLIVFLVPAVKERLLQGFNTTGPQTTIEDAGAVTSGRTNAWPFVIDKIGERPLVGYGGLAMARTGVAIEVHEYLGFGQDDRGFAHPHNAYLRVLFDTGFVGTIPVLMMYWAFLRRSLAVGKLDAVEAKAISSTALALLLALLVAGVGSQNLYPVQGAIALWAVLGLMLRYFVDGGEISIQYTGNRQNTLRHFA